MAKKEVKKEKTDLEKWGEVVAPKKDESFQPKDYKELVLWYREQIVSGSVEGNKKTFLKLSGRLIDAEVSKVKTTLKKSPPKEDE